VIVAGGYSHKYCLPDDVLREMRREEYAARKEKAKRIAKAK